ncbi:hypothetical protein Pfo_019216 [Paulownia fortunei]|nr:hypothetical protein Pfo_019216 [Paulownia fortunei]
MVKQVICLKMHPKPNQKLFFFIQANLLSIYFPGFFCGKYITYPALNTNCSGEPFQCGSIRYISYPFWGGSRPLSCGRQGFELICQGNVPMLNMSSLSYRVQEIDFSTNTLKVAREDLWNYTCPKVLHNTTIDLDLFKYLPKSNDENVTLYFDCTDDQETLPNQFSCDVNGVATINLFKTGDASSGPGPDITCNNNISVPVNQVAAQSLQNPTASSINVLQAALASGFSIQWLEDEKQYSAPFCNRNVYASCISSSNHLNRRPVYRSDPITVPAAAPEERQGPPPVQSPGSAAKGEGINTQTGNGMPPVQSPGYPPESVGYYRRTGNGKYRAKKIAIVVTLSITVMIVVSISIRCCLKRQHWPSGPNQVGNQDVEKFLLQQGSLAPKRYKYSEIKKITKSFNDKLGQGGYGSVYKGVLPDGCLVAVKVLIETDSNGEEFINEVASISRTSHVNIVNLLGFCYDRNKRALVYEFMSNKSLDKFIRNSGSANTDCHLDLEKLYKIAVEVAKGLEYLHTGCNTRIVHFDIKPQNILLDEDLSKNL